MRCGAPHSLVLVPTLLGRDGALRAYTLVADDRPSLTLDAWMAETAADVARRDRLLVGGDMPPRGLVGLAAPTGCIFAAFVYSVEAEPGLLAIRGPSWRAPMGGRMVPDAIEVTLSRLAADLGYDEIRRAGW
ncbi:hypothetical protein [Thalassobaculum sp.]|uniref:hypothetical protein n=1 Tax=Thalassobaculum sp. TaxID=2022740 RepID=UPI0032EFAD60